MVFGGVRSNVVKPKHQVGDIVYVRETYTVYQTVNYIRKMDGRSFSEISDGMYAYKADGFGDINDLKDHIRLMSDCSLENVFVKDDRWFPSIHMPKSAARIFLQITDVWVERLQDMTELDAYNEGITVEMAWMAGSEEWHPSYYDPDSGGQVEPIKAFEGLWNRRIPKKYLSLYGWDANPYVWVYEFERLAYD